MLLGRLGRVDLKTDIKINSQSNLTTGRIAAAHAQFSGIRHAAPVYHT